MKSLESKIILNFVIVSLFFLALTIIIFIQINELTKYSKRIQHVLVPAIEANLRMANAINTSLVSLQSWILLKDQKFIRQRHAFWSVIDKNHRQLINYSKKVSDSDEAAHLSRLAKNLVLFKEQQNKIENVAHTQNRSVAIQMLKEKTSPLGNQLIATLRHISDPKKWQMERAFIKGEDQEKFIKNISIVFLVLSIVGGAALGLILVRAVIIPLNRTMKLADAISKGDYSVDNKIYSGDKKLDKALKTMTHQLDDKNRENEHQRDKLEKYNKELETSNEELSQFSYRTSHDLKAPLITVRGLANVICEDLAEGDYEEVEQNSRKISTHVQKLEDLVVDILNLSKAELEITKNEKLNITNIVHDIESRLQSIYIDNQVELVCDIDSSMTVYSSKVRLTQILENLISNAIKYKDMSKANQFVKISFLNKNNKQLCIVEDNGIGIPNEFKDQVFNMFQRFHPKIAYGSGLGLYIIKKHVEKMKGKITFVSTNKGTKFIVELPKGLEE